MAEYLDLKHGRSSEDVAEIVKDICKFADDENNVNGEPESRFCLLMGDVQEERDALKKDWKKYRGGANR